MRGVNRSFNLTERLLLLVLSLLLVGLAYYRMVHEPVSSQLESLNAERRSLETELDSVQMRAAQLSNMKRELTWIDSQDQMFRMESYNNVSNEFVLLSEALAPASEYRLDMGTAQLSGSMVRRPFTLQFTVGSEQEAKQILTTIVRSRGRCMIGDIDCSVDRDESGAVVSLRYNLAATFYETMEGGKPDAGLSTGGNAG